MRRRRFRVAASAAAAIIAITAGGAVAAQGSTAPSSRTTASAAAAYDPAGILDGERIRGMVLVKTCLPNRASDSDLDRLKAIGVNTIVLVMCSYVDNARSSLVQVTDKSPTKSEIVDITTRAHARGFAVQYVPMFAPGGDYFTRWKIRPADVTSFFKSYRSYVYYWAKVAARNNVEIFSLGSEAGPYLEGKKKRWRTTVKAVRQIYGGLLTYQTTALHVFDLTWWKYLDLISTSAHFSLTDKDRPPVDELKYVWKNYWFPKLKVLADTMRRPLLFAEIGYASVRGTARRPAMGARTGEPWSQGAQADAYRAFLQTSEYLLPWFRGANWFYWQPFRTTAGGLDTSFSPKDKTAECALARVWSPGVLARNDVVSNLPTVCSTLAGLA